MPSSIVYARFLFVVKLIVVGSLIAVGVGILPVLGRFVRFLLPCF